MKKTAFLIKKLLNNFGYDIKIYRSFYKTIKKKYDIKTIIDVGANDGFYSKRMRGLFPNAKIFAFEPLPDCYNNMKERMGEDGNFHCYNIALGDVNSSTIIHQSSFKPSSSILNMADAHKKIYPKSKDSKDVKIRIEKLDNYLNIINHRCGDLLIKMDVQGYEGKIIDGSNKILSKAAILIIETSFIELYEGQPLFNDISKKLYSIGFSYAGDLEKHYDEKDELIYQDSIFIRR